MAAPKKAKSSSTKAKNLECRIWVRVIPRCSKIEITSEGPDSYRVKLTAPPIEGEANEQLLQVLAESLSLPSQSVRIVSGAQSRRKLIQIETLSSENVSQLLQTEKNDSAS